MRDIRYDVSVIVCCYNPDIDKLIRTINSIIAQKDITIQMIITDDGSIDNCFDKVEDYLHKKSFKDYILVPAVNNEGTVKNLLKGLENSTGKYIKPISPGDCLYNQNALAEWIRFMKAGSYKWSFSNQIYYNYIDGSIKELHLTTLPRMVGCYKKNNVDKCRWNYVVHEDKAVGASTLMEYDICKEYLDIIVNRIKYSEDCIYKLMAFDGICGGFFEYNAVLYELGVGISTRGDNKWHKIIIDEWETADKICRERATDDDKDKQLLLLGIAAMKQKNFICKLKATPRKMWFVEYKLRDKIFVRKTDN